MAGLRQRGGHSCCRGVLPANEFCGRRRTGQRQLEIVTRAMAWSIPWPGHVAFRFTPAMTFCACQASKSRRSTTGIVKPLPPRPPTTSKHFASASSGSLSFYCSLGFQHLPTVRALQPSRKSLPVLKTYTICPCVATRPAASLQLLQRRSRFWQKATPQLIEDCAKTLSRAGWSSNSEVLPTNPVLPDQTSCR